MVNWRLTPTQLAALEFQDFLAMAKAYAFVSKQQAQIASINSAHTAWLLGADSGTPFGKFCEKYGIVDKVKDTSKVDKKAVYAKADRITEALKRKGVIGR